MPGPDTIQQEKWWLAHGHAVETKTTETAQQITYPGWSELIKDLTVKTPEDALAEKSAELKEHWNELIKPHSPLTPEQAARSATNFEIAANACYGSLTALVTAAEAVGWGQIETPAFMIPNAPVLRATFDAAAALRRAYLEKSILEGVRYKAAADHQPTILPEQVLLDAYAKGFIDETTFKGQMMYHGYTEERSTIYGATGFRMPDLNIMVELARRDILTKEGFVDWGKFHRIPEATLKAVYELRKQKPEPYRTADFAAKGLIGGDDLVKAFRWYGLDPYWAAIWAKSQMTFPSTSEMLQLLWRGEIDEATFREWHRRNSFAPEAADKLLKLKERIPPSSDLITMCVREAFIPEVYERVAPETPAEFKKWMKKQGFSEEWSNRYWVAHYRRMGVEQAWRAFYRGVFDVPKLEAFLKYADIHPDDRAVLTDPKVMYDIPTIRELGYGYDVGVYSKDDIEFYRRASGLSPEDAKKAAEAMVAYRSEAEREAVRREWMYAYANGAIDLDAFEAKLKELNTSADKIPLWKQRAKLYKERLNKYGAQPEARVITASEAEWAVSHGLRDINWLRKQLKALNWSEERINLAVERVKAVEPKDLSLSQLETLFKIGAISKDEFRTRIKKLGYSDADVDLILRIVTYEKPVEVKKLTLSQIQQLYNIGAISEEGLRNKLRQLNYTDEDVELLVSLFNYSPPSEPRKLSLTQLSRLYMYGLISQTEFKERLKSLGYAEKDVDLIMQMLIYTPPEEATFKPFSATEARDFYYYRIFDDTDLHDAYVNLGYSDADAWMLVVRDRLDEKYPVLRTVYSLAMITRQQFINELTKLGLDAWTAERLVERAEFELGYERLRHERDLTKSEILKGYKKGIITRGQAVELLRGIGYEEWEADYLIALQTVTSKGDPEGYWEMKKVVEAYRKARGLPYSTVPEEVIEAERLVNKQRELIEKMREQGRPEKDIAQELGVLAEMEAHLRSLLVKYGLH